MMKKIVFFICIALLALLPFASTAQDNYEIQVYSSETTEKGVTMLELHSNFTFDGSKTLVNDVLPTNHIFHETIEITHGFTNWFEVGFYFFNALGDNQRSNYVGSHIRPRLAAPEKWKLPIGLSLSAECGFQSLQYCEDDLTMEIRPIIDKKFKNLYISFNPTFDKSLHGLNQNSGFVFSPDFKIDYEIKKIIAPGLEYYGSVGPINHFDAFEEQQHQLFLAFDILCMEKWELNFGYGISLTNAADNSIFKIILGRKFK